MTNGMLLVAKNRWVNPARILAMVLHEDDKGMCLTLNLDYMPSAVPVEYREVRGEYIGMVMHTLGCKFES